MKIMIYQVLIIEDVHVWYEEMIYFLQQIAEKNNIQLNIILAKDNQTARQLMGKQLFHAVTIDLRLPEKEGGVLTSQPMGIELAIRKMEIMPLVWGHVFSGYAREHALDCYRKINSNKLSSLPPIWEKASSDDEGEDSYTQKQWAQRIMAGLLPRAIALTIPLVNKRPELKEQLNTYSLFGETMDFAIAAGRSSLPPSLAKSCTVIYRFLEQGNTDNELPAFRELLFLAEALQHYLWGQAAACLTAFGLADSIRWPLSKRGVAPDGRAMETALMSMCAVLQQQELSPMLQTWLDHLHINANNDEMNISEAFCHMREIRQQYYQNSDAELPWNSLIIPLRIILDACAFLASYPTLKQAKPAADGRWRFTLLQGNTETLPENEWTLAAGVMGQPQSLPQSNEQLIYQLWPADNNQLGALTLWPFAEQRVSVQKERSTWLLVGRDAHDSDYFWEFNMQNGRSQCVEISAERLACLKEMKVI